MPNRSKPHSFAPYSSVPRALSLLGIGIACALVASSCGDDVCGPVDGSLPTLSSSIGTAEVTWTEWRSSPNNDCGEAGGPVSLTLDAQQMGSNFALTLCLPRPDKLSATPVEITEQNRVQLIDVFASVDALGPGCLASLDRATDASGTVAFPGICGDGDGDEGYSLELDINIPMTIACGDVITNESMALSGLVTVEAIQF